MDRKDLRYGKRMFILADLQNGSVMAKYFTEHKISLNFVRGQELTTYAYETNKLMKDKIGDGRDVEDVLPALGQLLRDQGQSFERLLKSYTALKEKTTIVLSIQESPEWAKLQDVLYAVFEDHPEAFASFRALSHEKKLRLG